ncbi:MAG: sugar ABC transporter permease [Bdellovibrionota bacterium]
MSENVALTERRRTAYLFLLPSLILLVLVAAWPLIRTIWLAFTDATLSSSHFSWVGLDNFKGVLTDPDWWGSVKNTMVFTGISVTLETVGGLGIALLLHREFMGRGILRAAVMVPWAIPTVVSAKMWSWMFNDNYGVINDILQKIGIIHGPLAWMADNAILSMAAVVTVDVWKTTPFMTLLILAGLQSIPLQVYQSAAVDGASGFRTFFKITLPLIKPALVVAVVFRLLDALRIFDLIFIMTNNSNDTATMSVYARNNMIGFGDLGYGSAASTLVFAFIAIFTIMYLQFSRLNLVGGSSEKVSR